MTLFEAKTDAVKQFSQKGFSTAYLDVDCILQFLLKKDRTFILLHRDLNLSPECAAEFYRLLELRKTGFPVAYITGKKEFFGLEFSVTPDVLIPKPDTEILVEGAVKKILNSEKKMFSLSDVCTGSGCVGLSILHALKNCGKQIRLVMTDISEKALEIAKKNAADLFPENPSGFDIEFLSGDLLCGRRGFDCIVSNPPYVPHDEVEKLLSDGRSEPRLALDGDAGVVSGGASASDGGGLAVIQRLVPDAYRALNPGGFFLMESGEYQCEAVRDLFFAAGFTEVETLYDLSGQMRVTSGKK